MFTRIIAFFILIITLYVIGVFLVPDFADTVGDKWWNTKIRSLKMTIESASGVLMSDKPLIENITDIAEPYIDQTRATTKEIQTTLETKTQEVKQAADSVKKTYDAVEDAKNNVRKISTFGTGS